MPISGYGEPNHWLTCILVDPARFGATGEEIRILALERENIESRPLWKPMHLQPVFKDCRSKRRIGFRRNLPGRPVSS